MKQDAQKLSVIARRTVKAGQLEAARALYQELVRATRQEAGCIAYELGQADGSPLDFVIFELWEDPAALAAHQQTDHFRRLVPLLAELSEASQVERYHSLDI
jgi:quinol monooxygenase YgiN